MARTYTEPNQKEKYWVHADATGIDLIRYCWMRDLPYEDYVAFMKSLDRKPYGDVFYAEVCRNLDAQMKQYFEDGQ